MTVCVYHFHLNASLCLYVFPMLFSYFSTFKWYKGWYISKFLLYSMTLYTYVTLPLPPSSSSSSSSSCVFYYFSCSSCSSLSNASFLFFFLFPPLCPSQTLVYQLYLSLSAYVWQRYHLYYSHHEVTSKCTLHHGALQQFGCWFFCVNGLPS